MLTPGSDPECRHRGGCQFAGGLGVARLEIGGEHTPRLSEGLGEGEASGDGEMLDGTVADEALDRDHVGKSGHRSGGAREIALEEPAVPSRRRRRGDQSDELLDGVHLMDVAASVAGPGLQYGREVHRPGQQLGVVFREPVGDLPERRDGKSGRLHGLALEQLVRQASGHLRRVEVEAQAVSCGGEQGEAPVVEGHHTGGPGGTECMHRLGCREPGDVHHAADPRQEAGGLGHVRLRQIDHPHDLAEAPGGVAQREHGRRGRLVRDDEPLDTTGAADPLGHHSVAW